MDTRFDWDGDWQIDAPQDVALSERTTRRTAAFFGIVALLAFIIGAVVWGCASWATIRVIAIGDAKAVARLTDETPVFCDAKQVGVAKPKDAETITLKLRRSARIARSATFKLSKINGETVVCVKNTGGELLRDGDVVCLDADSWGWSAMKESVVGGWEKAAKFTQNTGGARRWLQGIGLCAAVLPFFALVWKQRKIILALAVFLGAFYVGTRYWPQLANIFAGMF